MALKRILVVEDDKLLSTLSGMFIGELGYELAGRYQSGDAMLKNWDALQPDMVLMDVQIKGRRNGIETARAIRQRKHIPIIFITGNLETNIIEEIVSSNFYGYLKKPFTKAVFEDAIILAKKKFDAEENSDEWPAHSSISAIVRQNGYISYASRDFKEFFGIASGDVLSKPMKDFLMQDLRDDFSKAVDMCFIHNVALKPFRFNLYTHTGKLQPHYFTGSPLYFQNEKSLYLSVY